MEVYILSHYYEYGSYIYKYKDKEEIRFLGAYLTKQKAIEAFQRYREIRGFKSHLEGFWIEKYEVDTVSGWSEGYVTYTYAKQGYDDRKGKKVYMLYHCYSYGKKKEKQEKRILGIYSTRRKAVEKIMEYQRIDGFSSHASNFFIESWDIDNGE